MKKRYSDFYFLSFPALKAVVVPNRKPACNTILLWYLVNTQNTWDERYPLQRPIFKKDLKISWNNGGKLVHYIHIMWYVYFLIFPACFSIPIIFYNLNFNCFNLSSLRNLQEQVKTAFCYKKLFWPFTVWINCSQNVCKFSAFEFQKFFLITRTIFSHITSEQFW